LLVSRLAAGSAPAVGAFNYRPVSSEDPVSQGPVSMTAVDPSGESAPSASLAVTAVYRAQLPAPSLALVPPASGCILAEPADWYGQSAYKLKWAATSDQMFRVYRAMDAALYERDREERAADSQPRTWTGRIAAITTTDLPTRLQTDTQEPQIRAAIQAEFNDLDAKIAAWKNATNDKPQRRADLEAAYKKLRNDSHEVLASLPQVAGAFALLTSKPLQAAGTTAEFHDSLPGRSSNRFFYRIGTVDGAGNTSSLSRPSPPVCCPDITPPGRPALIEGAGGAKMIILRWIENVEADLDGYRLYRADTAEAAKDIRLMTLHKNIARSPTATLRSGEVAPVAVSGVARRLQLDDSVSPNVTYHYRLVAVDTSGNLSEPSPVVTGRAYQPPPAPPVWNPPERKPSLNPTVVSLSWTHLTDQQLACLVERRAPGGPLWTSVSGWLPRGVYIFEDTPPNLAAAREYRLRVRDHLGQVAAAMPVVTLPATS
jgi:hypothetical protein